MSQSVLIVDDEEVVGDLISDVLIHQRLVPLLARSISEAMSIWEAERPNIRLLIADLNLGGGGNGIQLAERMLKESPDLRVIFTSGFPVSEADSAFLVEGVNFFKKPFRLPTLIGAVRNALS